MANTTTGRQWSLVNEDKKHYASKQPVGYKVCASSSATVEATADLLLCFSDHVQGFVSLSFCMLSTSSSSFAQISPRYWRHPTLSLAVVLPSPRRTFGSRLTSRDSFTREWSRTRADSSPALTITPSSSAGKFVQQTPKAPVDSLEYWMEGHKNIQKTDVVTWISFGEPAHAPY